MQAKIADGNFDVDYLVIALIPPCKAKRVPFALALFVICRIKKPFIY